MNIAQTLKIEHLKPAEYRRIVSAMFAYYFYRIDQEQFIEFVGDRSEGVRLKEIARRNGYLLKNCKLYAYAVHCARKNNIKPPSFRAFEVHEEDARILRRLNLNHLADYKALTLQEFNNWTLSLLSGSELNNYIGRFVSKKMSFLMKSYGIERLDIYNHLKESALSAVMKQYPRYESYLHFLNIAKSTVHNAGQTFITHNTSQANNRLLKNSDGTMEAVMVDISNLVDLAAPIQYGDILREKLSDLSKLEDKMSKKARIFLLCLAGTHHDNLSAFLGAPNEELAEALSFERYRSRVEKYFRVTPEQVDSLFLKLRAHLV